ncbi:uncharacterized protein CIMG_07274 [Coccidioides immitis RS]|uniref:Stress response protein Rds1 n=3 Tax=Coccidioides immitis TaxID=5501 RepID=J3K9Z8_COCIM|nr:uncharacterized protein CIMG_07274 [Coccidioides immitis RS]EAS31795.3 hypothetical protein CIMG_07274 [Coccidioides immitis RS]KMP02387.1 rds1 [Coccidioides immitis RMSCC 2394]KMU80880.1 rds1 [Coccidioides immitis RMSCC 3703]TPX24513.1 hypothetical protein DIZ76_013860 [Coccidioides immitis]
MKPYTAYIAILLAYLNSAVAAPPPVRTDTIHSSHGPFTGTPTTTGALSTSVLASSIAHKPPNPNATSYPSDGQLHAPQPVPYAPAGGIGTDGTEPVYNVRSDFDYQSLALALYQEWIELDLFYYGLAAFSDEDFVAAGLTAEDRYLIQFMAEQERGHATLISNMLGAQAPKLCAYNYPFTTVREYVDFSQKLTRFGESGVYGFLEHLDSREAATLLLQSITTEARQQMIFRQFDGLFPMPVWFEVGVPQSWAWTLMAPFISWCPEGQTRLVWQNFPALYILNQPNPARLNGSAGFNETLGPGMNTLRNSHLSPSESCLNATDKSNDCGPAITQNRSMPLSWPGREVQLMWETPGKPVGPNNSYITSSNAGDPKFVVWVTQLNVTYSPLTLQSNETGGGMNMGTTIQPNLETYAGDPAVNGTMFIAVTDSDPVLSPFNLSMINPHIVAGPALYQAG